MCVSRGGARFKSERRIASAVASGKSSVLPLDPASMLWGLPALSLSRSVYGGDDGCSAGSPPLGKTPLPPKIDFQSADGHSFQLPLLQRLFRVWRSGPFLLFEFLSWFPRRTSPKARDSRSTVTRTQFGARGQNPYCTQLCVCRLLAAHAATPQVRPHGEGRVPARSQPLSMPRIHPAEPRRPTAPRARRRVCAHARPLGNGAQVPHPSTCALRTLAQPTCRSFPMISHGPTWPRPSLSRPTRSPARLL